MNLKVSLFFAMLFLLSGFQVQESIYIVDVAIEDFVEIHTDCLDLQLDQSIISSAQVTPDSVGDDFSNRNVAGIEVAAIGVNDLIETSIIDNGIAVSSSVMDYIITEDNVILIRPKENESLNQLDLDWFGEGISSYIPDELFQLKDSIRIAFNQLKSCWKIIKSIVSISSV